MYLCRMKKASPHPQHIHTHRHTSCPFVHAYQVPAGSKFKDLIDMKSDRSFFSRESAQGDGEKEREKAVLQENFCLRRFRAFSGMTRLILAEGALCLLLGGIPSGPVGFYLRCHFSSFQKPLFLSHTEGKIPFSILFPYQSVELCAMLY